MTSDDAPGTRTCRCCAGVEPETPRTVRNRPGLPEISYRSGRHGDVRASLLAALTDHDRPTLGRLRTRDDTDLTVALLDAWAVTHDVLTFYTERLANESYLGTAVERTSLQELGRLVGHRLDPGVAAETHLAFTIERPPPTTAVAGDDPGTAPPVLPAEVTLEPGLRVQSIPGPGEQPQVFETVEPVVARPAWNAMPVRRTIPWVPMRNVTTTARLDGTGHRLAPGAVLLLASEDLARDRWDVRLLTAVDEDPAAGHTDVTWDPPLGSFDPPNDPAAVPEVFVLRRRIPVHGHSAPTWRGMNRDFREGYALANGYGTGDTSVIDGTEWPDFDAVRVVSEAGADSVVEVDLAGSHGDVAVGTWVVVTQEVGTFYRELYEVTGVAEASSSAFGVSGTVTRLTLRGEAHSFGDPRQVTVLAVADPLDVVDDPDDSAVTGQEVDVALDATALEPGRSVIVHGQQDGVDTSWVGTLQSATLQAGGTTTLRFESSMPAALDRSTAVVFGNVALATHGESVSQVLGDGDARRGHQAFLLRHLPLTHVQAATATGRASTLEVRVDDVRWTERSTLFGADPTGRVHTTRDEPDGDLSVVFGDGVRGRRLPSGSLNVRASYRTGLGAAGNVDADALALPMDRPLGLKAVTNPLPATGGTDPDTEDDARRTIPLPVRTLGRAVSLQDYADFALAFTGIGVADATVVTLRSGPAIVVTVGDEDRLPAPASTTTALTDALRDLGDPHVEFAVLPHRAASLRMALEVLVAEDHDPEVVLAAVDAAVRASLVATARAIGEPVHRSAVIATVAAVPGVVAVDLDLLHRTDQPATLEPRLVAAAATVGGTGAPVAAELLSLDDDPFTWLREMT